MNNDTRGFEYPWVYFTADPKPGQRILEVGGGLSGFQFTLAKMGATVVNVDPGMEALEWPVSHAFFDRANQKLHTNVELVKSRLAEADLPESSFDTVVSISVVEHIPEAEIPCTMRAMQRLLKPGGRAVLTVDLFLDLVPFSQKLANQYGVNISIESLIRESGLELETGIKKELFGFSEFDAKSVLAELPRFRIGRTYPVLIQCLVLRKTA